MTLTAEQLAAPRRRRRRIVAIAIASAVTFAGAAAVQDYRDSRTSPSPGVVVNSGTTDVSYVTAPGQSLDVSIEILNAGHSAVRFEGASLVAVSDYDPGVLSNVGIYDDANPPLLSVGWAPLKPSTSGNSAFTRARYRITELRGFELGAGRTAVLVYALRGSARRSGTFVAGGVRLTYRYQGHQSASIAWGAGVDCVGPKLGSICAPEIADHVLDAIDKIRS